MSKDWILNILFGVTLLYCLFLIVAGAHFSVLGLSLYGVAAAAVSIFVYKLIVKKEKEDENLYK